jgi:hypothetical protein
MLIIILMMSMMMIVKMDLMWKLDRRCYSFLLLYPKGAMREELLIYTYMYIATSFCLFPSSGDDPSSQLRRRAVSPACMRIIVNPHQMGSFGGEISMRRNSGLHCIACYQVRNVGLD